MAIIAKVEEGIRVTREEVNEICRRAGIEFVELQHVIKSKHSEKVLGFEDVIVRVNAATGPKVTFNRNGSAKFEPTKWGDRFAYVPKTKHNFRYLAATFNDNVYTIADHHTRQMIAKLAEQVKRTPKNPASRMVPPETPAEIGLQKAESQEIILLKEQNKQLQSMLSQLMEKQGLQPTELNKRYIEPVPAGGGEKPSVDMTGAGKEDQDPTNIGKSSPPISIVDETLPAVDVANLGNLETDELLGICKAHNIPLGDAPKRKDLIQVINFKFAPSNPSAPIPPEETVVPDEPVQPAAPVQPSTEESKLVT